MVEEELKHNDSEKKVDFDFHGQSLSHEKSRQHGIEFNSDSNEMKDIKLAMLGRAKTQIISVKE